MVRDSGVILISDDESKESVFSDEEEGFEDGREEEHVIEWEEPDHGIHADMARFPRRTRKEVMAARA